MFLIFQVVPARRRPNPSRCCESTEHLRVIAVGAKRKRYHVGSTELPMWKPERVEAFIKKCEEKLKALCAPEMIPPKVMQRLRERVDQTLALDMARLAAIHAERDALFAQ